MALPIAITNTHAVGIAQEAIINWVVTRHPALAETWMLPVAAETWDGYLNDINGGHVQREHVLQALDAAAPGPFEEGSVGGGTGHELLLVQGRHRHRVAHHLVRLADVHGRHAPAVQLRRPRRSWRSPACRSAPRSRTTIRWRTGRWRWPAPAR